MEITFKPSQKQFQAWEYLTDQTTTELGFGGAACFTGETEVLTSHGYLLIKDIVRNEKVLSLNKETKELELKRVLNVWKYGGDEARQEMIQLKVYGNTIYATPHHRFLINGYWLPIGLIRERILDVCEWDKQSLLDLKSRTFTDKELESIRARPDHETCTRWQVLLEDDDNREWENAYRKDPSFSGSSVHTEPREQNTSESQEFQPFGQPSGELGMGNSTRELELVEGKTAQTSNETTIRSDQSRGKEWDINLNGGSCAFDTLSIQETSCDTGDVGKGISCKPSDYQRYRFKEELEARELEIEAIESIDIIEKEGFVYDLEVKDNHNYLVSRSNIIVSNSGGKSFLGCFWLLSMCLAYPGTGWLMGRKEMINLRRTTLITFFKVCETYGLKPEDVFTINHQTNIITFHNKSQIFLFDLAHQPTDPLYTRLGSLELTGAFVDESNEIDPQAINIVKTRLGRRMNEEYKLKPKLLETFNPDKGHVYQDYYKPWKENTLPEHRKFIRALPADNPYTTVEYLNQLRNADKVTQERLLHGNFEYDDDPTRLMQYDAITDLWSNTVMDNGEKYITADIARYGQDKTVIGLWYGLILKKVLVREKQDTAQTADDIRILARDERVPFSHILVDEDGIGGGVKDQLPGIKGFVANTVPFVNKITHQPENYANLKAQCTYLLASSVNNHQIAIEYIDADFRTKTIEELEQIKTVDQDKDGKKKIESKDKIKDLLGRSPDRADMLMMRMWFECLPTSNTNVARQSQPSQVHVYGKRVFSGTPNMG